MSPMTCDQASPLLPELEADGGTLDRASRSALLEHVATCDACRAELELIARVRAAAPVAPADLRRSIMDAATPAIPITSARAARRAWRVPATLVAGLAAAAVVVVLVRPADSPREDGLDDAPLPLEEALSVPASPWPGMDGVVAGGTTFDGLTEAELESLLEELES